MPLFRVGDYVTVREDLTEGETYYNVSSEIRDNATSDMVNYTGEIIKIAEIMPRGKYHLYGVGWLWTEEMFVEGLNHKEYVRYIGDDEEGFVRNRIYKIEEENEDDYLLLRESGHLMWVSKSSCIELTKCIITTKKVIPINLFKEFEV